MKDDRTDIKLDELIRAALATEDAPAPELDNMLKAAVYQRQNDMRRSSATRAVPLWYLPMALNLLIFSLLAAAAIMFIGNPWLSYLAAGICLYIGAAGVLLTIVGVKRTNMKKDIAIHIRKGGAPA